MAAPPPMRPPLHRSLSSENVKVFAPEKWRRNAAKKASPNVRAFDSFVRDTFMMSRAPLFRRRSYYELCPLGLDPEPRDMFGPPPPEPMSHLPMPSAPFDRIGDKPLFEVSASRLSIGCRVSSDWLF